MYQPNKEWVMMMNKKAKTMKINAPKDIMLNLRIKFPGISDSNLVRVMYNSSLLKVESKLRNEKKKKNIWEQER